MKSIVKICTVCAALASSPALAADVISATAPDSAPVDDGWTFSVTPYFWAASLSGETSQFGLPVIEMDASFRRPAGRNITSRASIFRVTRSRSSI